MLDIVINRIKASAWAAVAGVQSALTGTDLTAFGFAAHKALDVFDGPVATLLGSILGFQGALRTSKVAPDPAAILGTTPLALQQDPDGALQVRARVKSDEGAFADDFTGAEVARALSGTAVVLTAGGAVAVVGVNTLFLTEVRTGDYFELDSDEDPTAPVWARVASITDDTHLTLAVPYTGTTGGAGDEEEASVSNWVVAADGGGDVSVASSIATLEVPDPPDLARITRYVGPLPIRESWRCAIQTKADGNAHYIMGRFGLIPASDPATLVNAAYFTFNGLASATQITCATVAEDSSSPEFTYLTLAGGLNMYRRYEIWAQPGCVRFYIDGDLVATHRDHIPQPYVPLMKEAYALGINIP